MHHVDMIDRIFSRGRPSQQYLGIKLFIKLTLNKKIYINFYS